MLQREGGIAHFFRHHRGQLFASSALMAPISRDFVEGIRRFADREDIPIVHFKRKERKDEIAKQYLKDATQGEGVLFIGVAQEKSRVVRTEKRHNPETGAAYPWLSMSTAMVNQYYFYCVDNDFGPFCIKLGSYFPYNGKLIINGHEYAKRQLDQAGGRASQVRPIFDRRITRRTPRQFRTRVITEGVYCVRAWPP